MRSETAREIWIDIPEEVRKKMILRSDRPFSLFATILSDELTNWNQSNWSKEEFISEAAGEAWNLDEFTEEGYIALKRMLSCLVDPENEAKDLDEFTNRLEELYELRKSNL